VFGHITLGFVFGGNETLKSPLGGGGQFCNKGGVRGGGGGGGGGGPPFFFFTGLAGFFFSPKGDRGWFFGCLFFLVLGGVWG